jgi:hypothetical protein
MQPYQSASEEIRRQGELPIKAAGAVGSLAASTYGGGLILNKVLPLLSKYIPQDIAIKGLSKIDTRFGKFINKAMAAGQTFDQVRDFIGQKSEAGTEKEEAAAQDPFLELSNYDPKLAEGVRGMLEKGWTPDKSNEIAHLKYGPFAKPIAQMEKDKGKSFINILKELFGKGKQGKAALQPQQEQMQAPQGQGQQQPQGGGDQALMAAFQKIMQM